jgi:uncharacterized protein
VTGPTVAALWRYPVKSMFGEQLSELDVVGGGVVGDRAYAFEEVEFGRRVSAKRHGVLMRCAARYLGVSGPGAPIEVTFPDGAVVRGDGSDSAALCDRVSALLGAAVRLTSGPPGTLVDAVPLHLLTTRELAGLARAYPQGRWDVRRFRPNIVVEDVDHEQDWLGETLTLGTGVTVRVAEPTSRCVMTTHPQGDLPADRGILRTLTRVSRRPVGDRGELPCAGWSADVVTPGRVRTGDAVAVAPSAEAV